MNTKFTESEFKYYAGDTDPEEFCNWIKRTFKPTHCKVVSGYDAYYMNEGGDYIRHRYNADKSELTVKRRMSQSNTFQRVEVDINLEPGQEEAVAVLAQTLGYPPEFTIYKTCNIQWMPTFNIVFYHVYDKSMKEVARILEIEADKSLEDPMPVIEYAEFVIGRQFPAVHVSKRLNKTMAEMFTTRDV